MAILKCKMCGGDLNIDENVTVAECEYCGTKQTVPTVDDDKKVNLFGRANRLRFACEFDKAAGVYESIVADFPEEAEAYWGLILCKYGIEYVDDPATAKKIPTCHRSSFDSVFDDSNFELVMENADAVARTVYREEAKQIEELRKGIIEVSSKEEPYDIFICYKETAENGDRTVDSVIAQDVYTELTNKGYRVFFSRISLEDKLGVEYEPYIFAALNSAKVMLAFGTDYEYYNAVWVKNEWSRFLQLIAKGEKKTLIPCYKDIDAYDMPKEFAKLQAQDMGKVGAIQDLLRGIEKILPKETAKTETVVVQQTTNNPSVDSLLERAFMFLEDGDWKSADEYCEKVLDIDPKCAKAYLGKLMAAYKVRKQENLSGLNRSFENNANYRKILNFADDGLRNQLQDTCLQIKNKIAEKEEQRRIEEEKKRIEEEQRRIKEEQRRIAEEKMRIKKLELARKRSQLVSPLISTGVFDTIAIQKNGSIVIAGSNFKQKESVLKWENIRAVDFGIFGNAVGLKNDGTVCSTQSKYSGRRDVSVFHDIVKIAVSVNQIVGLRSNGTVVATGYTKYGACNVSNWRNITAISTGPMHTVGLTNNGKVVATGNNVYGKCNVQDWTDIVSVAAGYNYTVALKSNGSVVMAGDCSYNIDSVKNWKDIVAIAANEYLIAGLKSNGTVIITDPNIFSNFNVKNWQNIVTISLGARHMIGVKSDGTVVSTGNNDYGQCDVSSFKLFDDINTFISEREQLESKKQEQINQEKIRRENLRKLVSERVSKNLCRHCGGSFKKGLFSTKCTNCGKVKDY